MMRETEIERARLRKMDIHKEIKRYGDKEIKQ
jgi:hypothetical protein